MLAFLNRKLWQRANIIADKRTYSMLSSAFVLTEFLSVTNLRVLEFRGSFLFGDKRKLEKLAGSELLLDLEKSGLGLGITWLYMSRLK